MANVAASRLPGGSRRGHRARAAVEKLKLWENGRTLRVKYLDGLGDVQTKVDGDRQGVGAGRQPHAQVRHVGRRRDPHQLPRQGLLVVDRRHRRPDGARLAADDELRLAGAEHVAARVPARRAPRVRPRPGHDPRAPEPGRPGPDPVGQAEGVRVLRPAGLVEGRRRLQHLPGLRRGPDEPLGLRPDVDHAVRRARRADRSAPTRSAGTPSCRPPTSSSCSASTRRRAPGMQELDVDGARYEADLSDQRRGRHVPLHGRRRRRRTS